jgi:excisionase family DNA binding protein
VRIDLSPKDLADVIGVSESSLKRWVDEGKLEATRTAGGHRRIPLHAAMRFIRDTNARLTRPDLLGLPDFSHQPVNDVLNDGADAALLEALQAGDARRARGLVFAYLLHSRSVAGVCDGPIAHAMHRIGEMWLHSDRGVMVEHRATEICLEILHQVRQTIQPPNEDSPVAIGGAPEGEPYTLSSLMAATVLMESGYRDVNLGATTPIEAFRKAVLDHRPRLVWISVSTDEGRATLFRSIVPLAEFIMQQGAKLVIGGRAVAGHRPPDGTPAHVVASMSELAAFARALRVSTRKHPAAPPPSHAATLAPPPVPPSAATRLH